MSGVTSVIRERAKRGVSYGGGGKAVEDGVEKGRKSSVSLRGKVLGGQRGSFERLEGNLIE